MPGEDEPPPAELQRLVNHCERSGLAIIIGADSNAHHPLWGMKTSNNRGAEPTFVNKRCRTIIDLTLASEEVSELVMGWHVSQEASCSDHRWIRFNLLASSDTPTARRNPRKTDRASYRKALGESLDLLPPRDDLREPAQIEQQVNILTDTLIDSYHKACPLKPPARTAITGHQWWGPELERLRRKTRKLFNRAMNTTAEVDWDNYYEAKARYKKRLRYWRSLSWRNFCSSIETLDQANRVRKTLAHKPTSQLGSLRKPDGTYTSSPAETQRLLLVTHFPGCVSLADADQPEEEYSTTDNNWQMARRVVTAEKLRCHRQSPMPWMHGEGRNSLSRGAGMQRSGPIQGKTSRIPERSPRGPILNIKGLIGFLEELGWQD
ncbi:uncharacterized protein LOC134651652 [Cydia amplana]|uniref:uncharacterized protein LOC134651652 n=1 Tax=Cydia amplana TaxID=1869771 RepID=UPI002FE68FC2